MRIHFKRYVFLAVVLLATPLLSVAQRTYEAEIQHMRDSIDNYFKNDSHSPLDSIGRVSFSGLKYFDIDSLYKVPFTFKKKRWAKRLLMKTTTDRLPAYRVYGTLHFEIHGTKQKLTLYQNIELSKRAGYESYLFCPFKDLTNGQESYGGGRYLDFKIPDLKNGTLDFNLSYNPYCAYNYKYSCPIPPINNHLTLSIKSGIKKHQFSE